MELLLIKTIAFLVATLIALVGWIGNKLFDKIDRSNKIMFNTNRQFNNRLHEQDKRITILQHKVSKS